jgi:thiamine kinase-like enzyme
MFLISTENVLDYLVERKICEIEEVQGSKIEPRIFKNFNLLIHLMNGRSLLVKQEPHDQKGETSGDFLLEWQLHQLLNSCLELNSVRALSSEIVEADLEHSILVFNYLKNYTDLDTFYDETHLPLAVSTALGKTLGTLHQATFNREDYQAALQILDDSELDQVPNFTHGLEPITPEIFGTVSVDGLKFYQLYQRYPELGEAIASLRNVFIPCCLTHNDLKFSNILLHHDWDNPLTSEATVRLIDWEKWSWGDPASDLGTVIAEFLKIWLKSLTVSPDLDIHLSLRSATTPLEAVQPSMIALMQAYLSQFPELQAARPALIRQVIQFTGLALIESIQAKLHYLEPFGNVGICMLQVAKTLLCEPEQSIPVVFGHAFPDLIRRSFA